MGQIAVVVVVVLVVRDRRARSSRSLGQRLREPIMVWVVGIGGLVVARVDDPCSAVEVCPSSICVAVREVGQGRRAWGLDGLDFLESIVIVVGLAHVDAARVIRVHSVVVVVVAEAGCSGRRSSARVR
jgi:hypothetical protein